MLNSLVALRLGLPFVPSFLGLAGTVEDVIYGVDHASAGAGLIFACEFGIRVLLTFPFLTFTFIAEERTLPK